MKIKNVNNFFFWRDREKTRPVLESAWQNLQETLIII